MQVGIYTSDLVPQNQYLMPWRLVLEVGRAAPRAGHRAVVLSGRRPPASSRWDSDGCPVEEIAKPGSNGALEDLRQTMRREKFDVLFLPVAWWIPRWQADLSGSASIPIVWYIPGACYRFRQTLRAVRAVGVRATAPFLIQATSSKRRLVRSLHVPGARLLITASEFNRSAVCRAGWPAEDVRVIPPGRARDRACPNEDHPIIFPMVQSKLAGRPFYLFLGPPTAIRGIGPLLRAFDILARARPDVCLLCLFRSDPGSDAAGIRRQIESSPHAERILCVWNSVGPADLGAFLDACHAVVLPFLLVSSEIPLAVIEAAGHGKPVLTTGPGGTADFVREFGLAVPAGHGPALAEAMRRLLDDQRLHAERCGAARRLYAAHPTWEQVARAWLAVAEKALEIDK